MISAPPSLDRVKAVWEGRSGDATRELYVELTMRGPIGELVVNLFRANKNSTRAKEYRGRRAKGAAYDAKQWAVGNLETLLGKHGAELGIAWGWKEDPEQELHNWVIYIDLPTGQASFHQGHRGAGPDYLGDWDRSPPGSSGERIILLAAMLLDGWPTTNRLAEIAAIPDSAIDTSDIPEATPAQLRRLRRRLGAKPKVTDDEPLLPL